MKQTLILGTEEKNNLKIVLDYVERYNKQDEEVEVAQASAFLTDLMNQE